MNERTVTHVSFSALGGAGAVAARLAAGQQRLGWNTRFVTLVHTPFPRWAWKHPVVAGAALSDFFLVRKGRGAPFFSLFRAQHHGRVARGLARTEGVLHLHWLPGMLWPPRLIKQPPGARRIIWSIQDLWPFTGGCHYANGCSGFTASCAACPHVRRPFQPLVARAWKRKRDGLRSAPPLRVITPSEWTRSLLQAGAVMRQAPAYVIPNPVNTQTFAPADQTAARRKWEIGADAFVIGVGAADLRDERKRIPQTLALLREWLAGASRPRPVRILIFGAGGPLPGLPPLFRFVGPSRSANQLAEWYNAMDAYVSLSRYETFGNTLAEAAACGTPSVCLTGSGMAEVVVPDRTGRQVRAPEELPGALSDWADDPSRAQRMGAAARAHAVQHFDESVVARQVLAVYTGEEDPVVPAGP